MVIKQTESITNHDVKAVEYFIKERFEALGIAKYSEFVHFGLTSQDINNTAIPLLLKHACEAVLLPSLEKTATQLAQLAQSRLLVQQNCLGYLIVARLRQEERLQQRLAQPYRRDQLLRRRLERQFLHRVRLRLQHRRALLQHSLAPHGYRACAG